MPNQIQVCFLIHTGELHKTMKVYMFTPAKWTPRRLLVIVLIVLICGSAVGMAASYWTASPGTTFHSTSNVNVTVGGPNPEIIQTGTLFPNAGSTTVLNTTFVGDNATATIQNGLWNGTGTGWINATVGVNNGNLTFIPDSPNAAGQQITPLKINGTFSHINITSVIPQDNYKEDLAYTTGAGPNFMEVSNLTAFKSYGLVDPISNKGYAVATANATGVATFSVPAGTNVHVALQELGTLFLRNQTPPHNLITDAEISVIFYEDVDKDDPFVLSKNSTGVGYIDLTELDLSKSFIIMSQAPNHRNMTTLIDDLSVQSTAFMLEKVKPRSEVTFILADQTGLYGPDDNTAFEIFRAINSSSYDAINGTSTRWLAVGGSRVGNSGLWNATSLETEVMYRLKIKNNRGDERSLGTFIPKNTVGNQIVTLEIKNINITADTSGKSFVWNTSLINDPATVRFSFNDTRSSTTNLIWNVSYFDNNSVIHSSTGNCAIACGTFSESVLLNASSANSTLQLKWSGVSNGTYIGGTDLMTRFGAVVPDPLPIDSRWLNLGGIGILTVVAGAAAGIVSVGLAGLIISALAGLLWVGGVITFGNLGPTASGGLIFLGLLISVLYMIGKEDY